MTVMRRQAVIVVLATSAFAWGAAGCGDDDDESSPAPQAAESTQPATAPEPDTPADGNEADAQRRPGSEEDDEDGGERGATGPRRDAQAALRSVTSSAEFVEGLRRYRELREQLTDGNPEGDERAAEEMEELERRFREALAEARQGRPVPDAPGYEFGEGPGLNYD